MEAEPLEHIPGLECKAGQLTGEPSEGYARISEGELPLAQRVGLGRVSQRMTAVGLTR
jgi:hypothetical protein